MTQRKPAEACHPGVQIQEEMEARGWTIESLADKLQWNLSYLAYMLRGDNVVRLATAKDLSRVFGTTEEFWLKLQKAHDGAG